jgi:membrane protease YdiL (CAAX protease family)
MKHNISQNRSPTKFLLLVLVLSIPFWILGAIAPDTTKILPIKLPISALMTFCPFLAAAILVYRKQKMEGVRGLLKSTFDYKKIKYKKWYLPIVLLMPFMALISYWYVRLTSVMILEPQLSSLSIIAFFLMFFIGAIGEELGWGGYLIEPLQNRYGALSASIVLGFFWAIWHIIPFSQAHQTPIWIVFQCICTVFLRIIMVWMFNNTGKSVFGMILFHTMINISPYFIPNYGAHYDPFIFSVLLLVMVVVIVIFWDSKTLMHGRL